MKSIIAKLKSFSDVNWDSNEKSWYENEKSTKNSDEKDKRRWREKMKDEEERANIYDLRKRRGTVPARFSRSEGMSNPARQTPESK